MTTFAIDIELPRAQSVKVTDDTLHVDLFDGRTISVPIAWYPRLTHAKPEERSEWRLIAQGRGIHWESIDEDISVEDLIAGRASGESQKSLEAWLNSRKSGRSTAPAVRRKRRPG